jgi:hypothetical protein
MPLRTEHLIVHTTSKDRILAFRQHHPLCQGLAKGKPSIGGLDFVSYNQSGTKTTRNC